MYIFPSARAAIRVPFRKRPAAARRVLLGARARRRAREGRLLRREQVRAAAIGAGAVCGGAAQLRVLRVPFVAARELLRCGGCPDLVAVLIVVVLGVFVAEEVAEVVLQLAEALHAERHLPLRNDVLPRARRLPLDRQAVRAGQPRLLPAADEEPPVAEAAPVAPRHSVHLVALLVLLALEAPGLLLFAHSVRHAAIDLHGVRAPRAHEDPRVGELATSEDPPLPAPHNGRRVAADRARKLAQRVPEVVRHAQRLARDAVQPADGQAAPAHQGLRRLLVVAEDLLRAVRHVPRERLAALRRGQLRGIGLGQRRRHALCAAAHGNVAEEVQRGHLTVRPARAALAQPHRVHPLSPPQPRRAQGRARRGLRQQLRVRQRRFRRHGSAAPRLRRQSLKVGGPPVPELRGTGRAPRLCDERAAPPRPPPPARGPRNEKGRGRG